MLTWLAPLLVFGLLVFVHELGHFVAAKLMGVYAPVFAFGWGPRLWGFRRGETDYRVSWFPVGGFVAMATRDSASALEGETNVGGPDAGERPGHQRGLNPIPYDPEAMYPFGPKPVPEDRWVESKPLWGKIFILSAGVIMNAALAWAVVVAGVWGYGRTFGGQFARVPVTLEPVIDSVVPGMPAAVGGLRKGDSVVAIGGRAVADWSEVVEQVSGSPGVALSLDVVRADGSRGTVVVTPELSAADSQGTARVGKVGVLPAPRVRPAPASLGQAIRDGSGIAGQMFAEVVKVVKGLFVGEVSVRQLGGPLRIAQVSYQVARSGLEPLLVLVAFLSVNLAVLNLLPIPVLDGGAIVMRLIEAAKGSPLSQRTQEYVMRFGVLVILTLFLIVNFNDIVSFFS